MAYQGEPYAQPRISYGKKRNVDQLDRREAKRASIGTYERKVGDRVYDESIAPEAFTVSAVTVGAAAPQSRERVARLA